MLANIFLTKEDFERSNWEKVIETVSPKTCDKYTRAFLQARNEAETKGDSKEQEVYLLLHSVTSMMLNPAEKGEHFKPGVVWSDGSRSAMPSDITEEQLSVLKSLLPHMADNEMKARVADVIWTRVRQGNFEIAKMAIEAYMASGENLLFSEFPSLGEDRITRALHLAVSLGRYYTDRSSLVEKIVSIIDTNAPSCPHFIGHLLQLLLEYNLGSSDKYAPIAETCALDSEAKREWYIARNYWEIKAKWHRKAKETSNEYLSLRKIAETYQREAEDVIRSGRGYMVAAHHIQSAIEALRRIPETEKEQKALHRTLLDYQKKSLNEFGRISTEQDITHLVEEAIERVKEKSFNEALFSFAFLQRLPDYEDTKKYVEEKAKDSPLAFMLFTNIVNSEGKTVGRRPSLLTNKSEDAKEALEAETYHWVRYTQDPLAIIVEATRRHLLTEHNPDLSEFWRLVIYNPFVPTGREMIFARGLWSGFHGDFLTALSLLIPQLENSIRLLLNRNGVITSGLSSEGIQEEYDLNRLLDMEELKDIFDEDVIFNLKSMLTSRFGLNFRNLLAHGLLAHDHFFSNQAIYIWWLILMICCLSYLIARQENKDAS